MLLGLLIIPAATVYLLCDSYPAMLFGGGAIGVFGSCVGLVLSYWLNLPSGACIVLVLGIILLFAYLFKVGDMPPPKLPEKQQRILTRKVDLIAMTPALCGLIFGIIGALNHWPHTPLQWTALLLGSIACALFVFSFGHEFLFG